MLLTVIEDTRAKEHASPAELMEMIIDEIYPRLFAKSAELIMLIPPDSEGTDLEMRAEKIYDEVMVLYNKEKLVLFPFISGLLREGKKSESCAPFKNVKSHYTVLLSLTQALRAELKQIPDTEKTEPNMFSCVDDFEKTLIQLQITKDKYLFGPLRSCTGCKLKIEY